MVREGQRGIGATLAGWRSLAVTGSMILAAMALLPASASANGHLKLSWSLPRTASEGANIPFTWTGRHLGRHHRLVIQKPEGTAHAWRTIGRLRTNSGSDYLDGLPLGKYRFRIADLAGRYVLAQQMARVAVFGQVPLSTLFGTTPPFASGSGVYATSSTSFPYATFLESSGESFSVEHNHCSAVHIDFLPAYPSLSSANKSETGTVSGTVSVVQASADPVSATVPYEAVGSVEAGLVPGQPWSVITSYSGAFEPNIYINGYAVCDSTEPFFH